MEARTVWSDWPDAVGPWSGRKQADRPRERPATRTTRARTLKLSDDIHDPLGNDDDLAGGLPVERLLHGVEGKHGRFDCSLIRIAGNRYVGALLAVHLHRQGDRVLDQERAVDLRPGGIGDEAGLLKRLPA